jgi:hypothetical protein
MLKLLSALPIGLSLSVLAAAPSLATQGGADQGISQASLSGSYLAGRFAGKQRDNAIAALYFQRALEVDPGNPVLIERAFVLDLGAGNMARAETLPSRWRSSIRSTEWPASCSASRHSAKRTTRQRANTSRRRRSPRSAS